MQDTTDSGRTTRVCSWNEWDPLTHVIVGRADGYMVQAPEPAVRPDWPDHGFPAGTFGPMPQEMQDRANAQLDGLAAVLEKRGIRVDRPTPIDFGQAVRTPDWEQESMTGCADPRDVLLTVGPEILEATMSFRSRSFEHLCYRPLLESYHREDPEFRWASAPRPRLTDASYEPGFHERWNELDADGRRRHVEASDWILTEAEPLFDAADVARFGVDLFVQLSMVTNRSGVDWLRRHYPEHRVHAVSYREELPWHIDATLVPLRPGLVLVNPERPALPAAHDELFERNGWEMLAAPRSVRTAPMPMCACSLWLNLNLFVVDPKTVCVEASETPTMDLLDRRGFEVIPVPMYELAPFGGGLHCATLDVHREGRLEDYLPRQLAGF